MMQATVSLRNFSKAPKNKIKLISRHLPIFVKIEPHKRHNTQIATPCRGSDSIHCNGRADDLYITVHNARLQIFPLRDSE